MPGNMVMEETIEPGLRAQHSIKAILNSAQTKWQSVDMVDLEAFGKTLVIDGFIQSTQCDEFVYHECLVHPAMLLHAAPKRVFIGGGGEGSTAREVLRHKTVERCVMVDIDGDVVDFCKRHLHENDAAFADKRLEVVIDDAKAWLENTKEKFDVIIMDLDDPLEGGPCYQLYTKEFYAMLTTKLNVGGIVVTQSGQSGIKAHSLVFSPIHNTMKAVYPAVFAYNQAVYSFLDEWGWNLAFTDASMAAPASLSAEEVDRRIAERVVGDLQFLDGVMWAGLWALSKRHRRTLAAETKVMSTETKTHCFMHNPGVATIAEKNAEVEQVNGTKKQRTE